MWEYASKARSFKLLFSNLPMRMMQSLITNPEMSRTNDNIDFGHARKAHSL
jgi:hypothetical protein